jgi:putative transposase
MAGLPQHIVIRGNNGQNIFHTDHDYRTFLAYTTTSSEKFSCAIHAYVLMPNHVHLFATPEVKGAVGKMVQLMARQYVQYFNNQYHRTGTLWEGRYKSALVDGSQYALDCYRYIERNPVRSGLVSCPSDYPWSSYRYNAMRAQNTPISVCDGYINLADDLERRASLYRDFCATEADLQTLNKIRTETNRSRVLGDYQFQRKIEKLLDIDLSVKARGGDRRSLAYRQSDGCCT